MSWIIVGGVWFWAVTLLTFVILVWSVNCERAGVSIVSVLAYLGLIHIFGNASVFSFIKTNPEYLYIGAPAFFLFGAIWSVIKWWIFVRREAMEYKEQRMYWLDANKVVGATLDTPIPESLKVKWHSKAKKPMVRHNKGKIITWMAFWPFSLVWTLLSEPWRIIYEFMSKMFQNISDRVFADLEKDCVKEQDESDD